MNESNKSPTEQSTRPEGNTPMRPSALERGIGANVYAKLRADYSGQNKKFYSPFLERKKTQSGHSD
jgi:hypothetical protein